MEKKPEAISIQAGIEPKALPEATPRVEATPEMIVEQSENALFPNNQGELNALMELVQTIAQPLELIVEPEIDFENLEAAAAGAVAGGSGEGNSFVRLQRIEEAVTPLQYEYGFDVDGIEEPLYFGERSVDVSDEDGEAPGEDEPGEEPSDPEDPKDEDPQDPPDDEDDEEPEPPEDDEEPEPEEPDEDPEPEDPDEEEDPEDPVKPPKDNNGHGNNTDGQDDDNPGQGSGGPNEQPKDGDDTDEGNIGNQGDDRPGVGNGDKNNDNVPDDSSDTDTGGGVILPPGGETDVPGPEVSGSNPGNDKEVGNSPWDGETGASGKPGRGQHQDGVDVDENQPGGKDKGQNLLIEDLLQDSVPEPTANGNSFAAQLLFDLETKGKPLD